jgi:hypothetical protein
LALAENTTHNGDDNEELVLSLTMISSPSKARNNNNRSRYILVVSDRCMRSNFRWHSRKTVSALLMVILLFPVLFYFSTSSVPDAVLPAVCDALPSYPVSEASSATVLSETPKKKKHETQRTYRPIPVLYILALASIWKAAFKTC